MVEWLEATEQTGKHGLPQLCRASGHSCVSNVRTYADELQKRLLCSTLRHYKNDRIMRRCVEAMWVLGTP